MLSEVKLQSVGEALSPLIVAKDLLPVNAG